MSTKIRIFEYSNKMALGYYSYSYSCHFPSTNIIGSSLVDFWTTEYIQIFICKFSKIRLHLNICSEPYFNIQLSIFNEKCKSRYNLCIKSIQCKILFRGNISECFNFFSLISDEYKYLNKMTLKYYSYSYLCYFRNTNIFGYLFGKYVASEYIRIFIRYIMWHPNIFGYLFVSIL